MGDNWRETSAEWIGESAFQGTNLAGARVQMGTFEGMPGISPMEMLLLGVAGCTGTDIVDILKKMRQPLEGLKVVVRGKRADDFPKIYTDIEVKYIVTGTGVDPAAVERAILLSEEKYCSASIMLRASAKMSSSYEILAAEPAE